MYILDLQRMSWLPSLSRVPACLLQLDGYASWLAVTMLYLTTLHCSSIGSLLYGTLRIQVNTLSSFQMWLFIDMFLQWKIQAVSSISSCIYHIQDTLHTLYGGKCQVKEGKSWFRGGLQVIQDDWQWVIVRSIAHCSPWHVMVLADSGVLLIQR